MHIIKLALFLSPCLLFGEFEATAQTHSIGVKGGIMSSDIQPDGFIDLIEKRYGADIGISYEYSWKRHFKLNADLVYQSRGYRSEITVVSFSNLAGKNYDLNFSYGYLSLPLKMKYVWGNRIYGFGSLGIVPAVLLKAVAKQPTFDVNGEVIGKENVDYTKAVRSFDCAGVAEIGAGYNLQQKYKIYALAFYQQSLTTISTATYFPDKQLLHRNFGILLGMQIAIKQSAPTKQAI